MTNSKNKGNNFERKIANLFSSRFETVTGLASAFRRSTDSGSYFGKTNQSRIETHGTEHASFGDIICPSSFRFCVECKHYKTPPSFNAILKQDWKLLDEWIGQAEQDSLNSGKETLIIVKFNNIVEFVAIKETFGNLIPVMKYKNYYIITLTDFLKEDDSNFFTMSN